MTTATTEKPDQKAGARKKLMDYIRNDVANIDVVYPYTVLKSLTRLVSTSVANSAAKRKAKEELARAVADYQASGDSVEYRVYRNVASDMREDFVRLEKAYRILEENVARFRDLELMRFTEHGKDGLDKATLYLGHLREESEQVHKNWTALLDDGKRVAEKARKQLGVQDIEARMLKDIDEEFDVAWFRLETRAKNALLRGQTQLKTIELLMNAALEFEGFKAVAVSDPGKVQKWVERANATASQVKGASSTAAENVPSSAGTIHSSVNAVVGAGLSFVEKVSVSWANNREAKKIMSDPARRQEALHTLNQKPLLVALYLKDKYLDNLAKQLDLLEPLAFGGTLLIQVGMDATGAGALAGPLVGQIWPIVRTGLEKFVKGMQEARIDNAAEEMGIDPLTVRGGTYDKAASVVNDAMDKTWEKVATTVGAERESEVERVLREFLSDFAGTAVEDLKDTASRNAAGFLSPAGMVTQVAGQLAGSFIKQVMKELHVKAAQRVTGDDILAYVASNTDVLDQAFRETT